MNGADILGELQSAGFSEQEVHSWDTETRSDMAAAGFSHKEINEYFGTPEPDKKALQTLATRMVSVPEEDEAGQGSILEQISSGLDTGYQSSVTGLLQRGKSPDQILSDNAPMAERIANHAGMLVGDFPAMVGGAFLGGGAALPVGQTGPQVALPEEILTVPALSMAGAFALPAMVRESLIQEYQNGTVKTFGDFWERLSAIMVSTGKGALTGLFAGKAGELAKPGVQTLAAEIATMVSVGSALEGKVPEPHDFVDAAILIGGVKGAIKTSTKLTTTGRLVVDKLHSRYKETGIHPLSILNEGLRNPAILQKALSSEPRPPVKPRPSADKTPISEDEKTVLGRVSVGENKKTGWAGVDWLYTHLIDKAHPLKQIVELLSEGKELPADMDPYKLARTSVAATSKANLFLEFETRNFKTGDVTGKGLRQILSPIADSLDGLRAYAVSRRAVELAARDKPVETGVDLEVAGRVIAGGRGKYESVFRELVDFQDRVTEYLRDSGVISKNMYSAIREANKDYVPFFRVVDEKAPSVGKGLRTHQPIKKIKGSEKVILDPLESVIKNTYLYVQLAERNATGSALVDLAKTSELNSSLVEKVKQKLKPIKVSEKELERSLKEYAEELGIELTPNEMLIFRPMALPQTKDQIVVYRKGDREVYKVDEEVARFMNGMDHQSVNLLTRILAIPAKTLRAGAILNPDFFVRNMLRDNITAAVYSENGFRPFIDAMSGLTSLVKQDKAFKDWVFGGGPQATLVSLDRLYLQKNLKTLVDKTGMLDAAVNVIKSPLGLLRVTTELFENATRLGEFKKAMEGKRGKAALVEAGFQSREVTLDFARMGSSMRGMNMITAFWNARVQGYDRMYRAFRDNPGRATTKAVAMITMPSVLLWMSNHDDPRYKQLPSWQKDLFWIVMTDEHIFRIPKPFELGILFGTFPERMLDKMADSDENLEGRLFDAMAADSLATVLPNASVPVLEQVSNHSFFRGTALIPSRLEHALPEEQYTNYTTEIAKSLGRMITFFKLPGMKDPPMRLSTMGSAIVIENYIRQWTGGLGMQMLQLVDKGLREAGVLPDPVKPASTLADIPFIKSFVVRYPTSAASSITDFYDNYAESVRYAGSFKKRIEEGRVEDAMALLKENPERTLFKLNGFRKILTEHSGVIQMIHTHPSMPPNEKRQIIDTMYMNMIQIALSGNEVSKNIKDAFAELSE